MTIFACLYVPNFAVEAWLRSEPELRGQALAVLEGKPPLQKVFAVNEKAARAGIEPEMTKAQAELCREVALRPRSALQEVSAHSALLDCAQSFSPCVEDTACDTVLLDLAGLEPLFGTPAKIARDLSRRASDLGLEANVAVAASTEAAVLAARGFAGVTVIPCGNEAEHLGSLSVEILFAGLADPVRQKEATRILETLNRWGVRTLRALGALPEMALSERLGQEGLRLQQLSRGAVSRTLTLLQAPLVFEEAIELEDPIVLLEPLAFLLQRLLDQVCTRLATRALATQELRLQLELDPACHPDETEPAPGARKPGEYRFERTLRLPVPMLDVKIFLKLLQLDLKAHPPGAPILKIHLAAEPVRPRPMQGGLFLPPTPEPEKLALTLARIAGVVGEGRVGSLEMLDTYRPEGFRIRPFVMQEAGPQASPVPAAEVWQKFRDSNLAARSESKGAVTALRMFRPAVRTTVTLRDGKPARIACGRRPEIQGTVLWTAGPWRSSGDWWEKQEWARDEWDIAVQGEKGIALYRLVRDLLEGAWFVEGSYD